VQPWEFLDEGDSNLRRHILPVPNEQNPNSVFTGSIWGYGGTPSVTSLTNAVVLSLVDGVVNATAGGRSPIIVSV
jgi:hypothetical protein